MYTINQLEVFRLVAETGSFNKAAEKAYVTPNAVMKHINNLEEELGITLFNRTFRGQNLTEAGECLYKNAVRILNYAANTIQEVRDVARSEISKVRVGRSIMTPIEPLNPLLNEIRKEYPGIRFEFIPFENVKIESNNLMIPNPGTIMDIVIDAFDEYTLKELSAKGVELTRIAMYAVVSTNHEFAEREEVGIEELAGKTLVYRKGLMRTVDDFIVDLNKKGIEFNEKLIEAYTLEAYDEVANSDEIMIGIGNFKNTHPFLKQVPLNYEKKSAFGILYPEEPTESVKLFVQIVKDIMEKNPEKAYVTGI